MLDVPHWTLVGGVAREVPQTRVHDVDFLAVVQGDLDGLVLVQLLEGGHVLEHDAKVGGVLDVGQGLVDELIERSRASLADLKRLPTVSRHYFMECSGTTGAELMRATQPTVQRTHGLVSTSEWTGVPLST